MHFKSQTIIRLSTGLLSVCGALLITTFHLVVTAKSAGDLTFAKEISRAIMPLFVGSTFSFVAFGAGTLIAEICPDEEEQKHYFAKPLQSATYFITIIGTLSLAGGVWRLLSVLNLSG